MTWHSFDTTMADAVEAKPCTALQSQEMINSVFIHRTFLRLGKETRPLDEREDAIIRNDLSYTGRGKTVERAACLITCRRGVGGFSTHPAVQLRKCRPTPSFTPRQTLTPKFDQSPFYVNNSRGHRGPVSYIARLWCWRLRGNLPGCVMIFLRSGGRSGNRSRNCGFHLRGRTVLQRGFSERGINAAPRSGRHFTVGVGTLRDYASDRSGIGSQQEVGFRLRNVRLVLLDREHKSRENEGPQNSGCKPRSIAIETFDYVACQWTLPCVWVF